MTDTVAKTIVERAISANDLCGLLLGSPPYRFLPPGSPAPGDTDLIVLLAALYDDVNIAERPNIRTEYEAALREILHSTEGIKAAAYAVFFETFRKAKGRSSMNLPLDVFAAALRDAIEAHRDAFSNDVSGAGRGWPNGWLGELGRLSNQTVNYGGFSFA
jgi:hypothetical protein